MRVAKRWVVLCFAIALLQRVDSDAGAHSLSHHHEEVERDYHPAYLKLAYGSPHRTRNAQLYHWPVALLSIGHTSASYQNYGRLPSGAYFHHGLDIRANAGAPVFASRGGKVVNVENYSPGDPAYWEIAILDEEGYLWQYHHIERSSIPSQIFSAFQTGGSVPTGTKLGEVYAWTISTFGERYHHTHLNVLGKDKQYLSPFQFLEPLPDKEGPVIKDIFLFQSGHKVSGNEVSGNYTIAAEIQDLIMHRQFIVPPHATWIEIFGFEPHLVWNFDVLPGGSSNADFVSDFFIPSLTCGNYECRKITIDLGFSKDKSFRFPTQSGDYEMRTLAWDFAGNVATQNFSWRVR